MPSLAEQIAEEIFRTIERERRIIKDDLIHAVERCLPNPPQFAVPCYDKAMTATKCYQRAREVEAKFAKIAAESKISWDEMAKMYMVPISWGSVRVDTISADEVVGFETLHD